MDNLLALFELIEQRARVHRQEAALVEKLREVAEALGIPASHVEDALDSDRMLVIYEP